MEIKLVTRNDPSVQMFIAQARRLGEDNTEIVIGKEVSNYLFYEPRIPENQIFHLRPAKPREFKRNYGEFFSKVEEREAFDTLLELSRETFPDMIADFRICWDSSDDGKAFMFDKLGQQSMPRSLDYFRPRSSQTLRKHCYNGYGQWRGTNNLIEPFYEYCMQTSNRQITAVI